jgi:hypothetical protein
VSFRRRRREPGTGIQLPVPKHPFRDTAVFNGSLAGLLLIVAWFTGGELNRALMWAAVYFVAATAWSWYGFRRRLERERAAAEAETQAEARASSQSLE